MLSWVCGFAGLRSGRKIEINRHSRSIEKNNDNIVYSFFFFFLGKPLIQQKALTGHSLTLRSKNQSSECILA